MKEVIAILLSAIVCTSCVSERVSVLHRESFPTALSDRQIERTDFPALTTMVSQKKSDSSVIPGRLLVKIAKPETLDEYILPPKVSLPGLPDGIHIRHIDMLGRSLNGNPVYRVHMVDAMPARKLAPMLDKALFRILKGDTVWPRDESQTVSSVVIEAANGQVSVLPDDRAHIFPQLSSKSSLRNIFKSLGVGSIRRVFRSTERQDAKGVVKVGSVARLLKDAKSRYPVRASRGYPDLSVPKNMENWFLVRLSPDVNLEKAYAVLAKVKGIESVQFDYRHAYHQLPQNEPQYANQWALQPSAQWGIDVLPAWNVTSPAAGPVRVAVIGSGIKEDLDEFAGRIWSKACQGAQLPVADHCEIAGNGIDDDLNGYIDDVTGITTDDYYYGVAAGAGGTPVIASDHETKVAAIIAANSTNNLLIAGAAGAKPVSLMNISVGGGLGCAELAEAILYATNEGADIINMSLGKRYLDSLVWEAVQAALTRDGGGVVLIASAGNNNRRITENYNLEGAQFPAWYTGVISVGGSDQNGHRWSDPAQNMGSNYGPGLDLVAPAKDVNTVTYPSLSQTTSSLTTMTGTSSSAALVSGVAAIVLSHYPTTRVERMNAWLRATATDITDPQGLGENLAGDDIYTGAGVVNANKAVTQQPDPVVVDIMVEKLGNSGTYTGFVSNGAVGSPDLGITVKGPVTQWRLDYGVGDAPSQWFPLGIPSAVATTELDVARTAAGWGIDVASGYNYLSADNLQNRQVYTLRLTARDTQNRVYTAYDWFMPLRAMLQYPNKNDSVPVHWGWPNILGVLDVRPGATYELDVIGPAGQTNPGWHVGPIDTANLYTNWSHRSAMFGLLMGPEQVQSVGSFSFYSPFGWINQAPPSFPAPPSGEGTHTLKLTVHSPGGVTTVDTQEVFVDNTAFARRPGWPVAIATPGRNPRGSWPRGVGAADMNGSGDRRVFVHTDDHFVCLKPDGTILWDLPMQIEQDLNNEDQRFGPSFLIDDLDGDGIKEILVAGIVYKETSPGQWTPEIQLHLLKQDGTEYNSNWPYSFPHEAWTFYGKLHAGDVNNDGVKEVVVVKRSKYPTAGGPAPAPDANLLVMNLNAQMLPGWPVNLGTYQSALQVGDVNGDGMAEILVDSSRLYNGTGQLLPGWPVAGAFGSSWLGGFQLVDLAGGGTRQVLSYDSVYYQSRYVYAVDVRNPDGSRYGGNWPLYLEDLSYGNAGPSWSRAAEIRAKVHQLIPGGPAEIALCYDRIRVLNADGTTAPSLPTIDLKGQCRGFDILDVDGDGQVEYVALVARFEDDQGWKTEAHAELEAYELNGTPLSSTNTKWPIRVVSQGDGHTFMALGNSVAVQDIDGDGRYEFINLLFRRPYRPAGVSLGFRDNLIEVLDIR